MKTLLLAAAAVAASPPPFLPEKYTLICDGEKATGFDWVGGTWVQKKFRPDRYIVTASPENRCFLNRDALKPMQKVSESIWAKESCISVRKFEKPYDSNMASKCVEYYIEADKTRKWSTQLTCDGLFTGDFALHVDGMFRRFDESSIAELPAGATRDSMVVEVGRCSRIS